MREERVLSEGDSVARHFVGSRVLSEYDKALARVLKADSERFNRELADGRYVGLSEEDVFGKYDWWQKKYGR
ncbi:MAG: hypothetical protein FWH05_08295 [Oscillospiraceae bacterium]|nr:hypothetical protein [Oscillospiraceae bacterium]